ncbi:hypothetical protein H9P43_003748 [Blastocladiella emersonii ATCC 22665]|nr:hypothetical protein H9P43_003748 [Blastocladiella emersonii ATCC 22665]
METFSTPNSVLTSFTRRALAYPLYRHRDLVRRAARDALVLLVVGGRRGTLKALLSIHAALERDEVRWPFNTLWIEPLIQWLVQPRTWTDAKWTRSWAKLLDLASLAKENPGTTDWDSARVCWEQRVTTAENQVASAWKLDEWDSLAREIAAGDLDADSDDESDDTDDDSPTSDPE